MIGLFRQGKLHCVSQRKWTDLKARLYYFTEKKKENRFILMLPKTRTRKRSRCTKKKSITFYKDRFFKISRQAGK